MKRRIFAIALTLLLLMSAISACGNFQSPPTSEPVLDQTKGSVQVIIPGSFGDGIHSVVIPSDISTVPTVAPTTSGSTTSAPTQVPTAPSSSSSVVTTPSSSASTKPSTGTLVDPQTCNHDFKQISFEDSTCAKNGKKVSYCAKCGTTRTESVSLKTEHTGGTATCQERPVCTVCGKTYGSFASHSWTAATCQSPATCSNCGITDGGKAGHHCENPPYNCTVPTVCDTCGTVMTAAKEHYFLTYCEDNAWCRDCGTRSDTIGPVGHTYSNGKCIRCNAKDPNYSGGGSSGSDSSDATIKYTMTFFPVTVQYGSITGCTHEVSGSDLILHVTMKRSSSGSAQALEAHYRITDGYFNVVANGSFTSASLSAGSTTTVTVTIPGIIKSGEGPYEVYLSGYPIIEW